MSDQQEKSKTGDEITAGNFTDAKGIAIGDGATVNIHEGLSTEDVATLMTELKRIEQQEASGQLEQNPTRTQSVHPKNIFISYKRHAQADEQLARYLHAYLGDIGHTIFIDQTMRTGTDWLEEIDKQIKQADYLIVLLSEQSAHSEMVQAELIRANAYQKRQGHPNILPVRIAYEELLPYTIDAFLSQIQYILWKGESDNERVSQEIADVINGQSLGQAPLISHQEKKEYALSEDGRQLTSDEPYHEPLPEFDPRMIKRLAVPGGAVKLRDKLYIERDADRILKEEIVDWGTTTTIRAPRQTGKTSLLMRGVRHASKNDVAVVFLDIQSMGGDKLASSDLFMREVAETFCHDLRLDSSMVAKAWEGTLGAQNKLTYFLEDRVLPQQEEPIVLAIDEADALLSTDFHRDFFGLLRSWHNRRARLEVWEMLNMVLVISTEPYLLIDDVTQSPFNVGQRLDLTDFNETQVRYLNRQHGSTVQEREIPKLMALLNGHPFLTRRLLYALAKENIPWSEMKEIGTQDEGPFGDHLKRLLWTLQTQPELRTTLAHIIKHGRSDDDKAAFRLLRAGLIMGSGHSYSCRCDLYQQYFEEKL